MPQQLSRTLRIESACGAGRGSFINPAVAGSSPAVQRDVAQLVEHRTASSAALVPRPTRPFDRPAALVGVPSAHVTARSAGSNPAPGLRRASLSLVESA